MTASARYASPLDAYAFGEHRAVTGSVARIAGRLAPNGPHPAEAGRYHLYAGSFCPRSHRATIVLSLLGLTDMVTVSAVDRYRDGRGWAFRERSGPDPVNGFTLLAEAYRASDPGYAGAVTVPLLWDRRAHSVVSNDPDTIDVDLATAFVDSGLYDESLHPALREIATLGKAITRAVYRADDRADLAARLHGLDAQVAARRFLVGNRLTLADIRLWTLLVRYDVGPNATGAAGAPLVRYPHLADYARRLYQLPAFRDTTDFDAFRAPLTPLPAWLPVAAAR